MNLLTEHLSKNGVILKISPKDFYFRLPTSDSNGAAGFRSKTKVKAGEFYGEIEIKCEIQLPEDYKLVFTVDCPQLEKIREALEFVKSI